MSGYIEQSLPFSGAVPLSRHTSAQGAVAAVPKAGRQSRAYLRMLQARGEEGATDYEAASLLGLMRSTINARRAPLCAGDQPWVTAVGTRKGPTGIANAVWTLTDAGRRATEAMREAR